MSIRLKSVIAPIVVALASGMISLQAIAGGTIKIGEDQSVSVGFGMRSSYSSVKDAAPDGTSRSSDFNLDSARLFFGASLNKNIKGMLNTEWDGTEVKIMDAVGQFVYSPELNVWAGRQLSPSDRANMAGPYYSLGGGYWAGVASRYGFNGGIFRGRDDGITVWGNALDNKLGYSFGGYEGHTFGIGSLTQSQATALSVKASDSLMYASRLQYDFWEAEPGYYGTGNYLGNKDILAIGLAGRYQKNGVLTVGAVGDYSSYNLDFLLEKKLLGGDGVSFEAAYYKYDTDSIITSEQGKAYLLGAGYILGKKIGWGKPQPFVRYQSFDADSGVTTKQTDIGMNYIIDGYNAQVSAVYSKTKVTSVADTDKFVVALQLQF
jgi:hypothetical protein